jgi:putative transcriptional regulator
MKTKKLRTAKEISSSIIKGLKQSLAYSSGKNIKGIKKRVAAANLPVYKGIEIKRVRSKHNLSQNSLAITLGVSKKTVEAWESNRNTPHGPAQRVLFLLDKKPEIINVLSKI